MARFSAPTFRKLHPLPDYEGPKPVHRCTFQWADSVDCFVRFNRTVVKGGAWETAAIPDSGLLRDAKFSLCPVAGASLTRHAAVMAFDYFHNRKEA